MSSLKQFKPMPNGICVEYIWLNRVEQCTGHCPVDNDDETSMMMNLLILIMISIFDNDDDNDDDDDDDDSDDDAGICVEHIWLNLVKQWTMRIMGSTYDPGRLHIFFITIILTITIIIVIIITIFFIIIMIVSEGVG